MEHAPLNENILSIKEGKINSTAWLQWFNSLVTEPALDPPGNTTLFLRGDNTWQIPGGFVPGAHANSHTANGSDPLTLSQSQITNLISDLANKASLTDARFVTNGNNHDHNGGDGGTIDHINLSNIGTNTHDQIDTHISNSNIHYDHSALTITGSGLLSGSGGDLTANRTFTLNNSDIDHNSLLNYAANEHIDWTNANSNFYTLGNMQVINTATPSNAIESAINAIYTTDFATDHVTTGAYAYIENTGNAAMGAGHGIAHLGLATDNANAWHNLYGLEGRVNGRSTQSGINYYGALGLVSFQGANFNGYAWGIQGRVEIYANDGATPLSQGIVSSFYSPAIIGGAIKYSFFGKDPLRIDNSLLVYDSAGGNYGAITKVANSSLFITSDNGQVNFDNEDIATTGNLSANTISANGPFTIQKYNQGSEPTISADGYMVLWINSNDANRVYLIFRRGSGDQVKVELT